MIEQNRQNGQTKKYTDLESTVTSSFTRRSVLKSLAGVVGYTTVLPRGTASEFLLGISELSNAPVQLTRAGKGIQIENGVICARFLPSETGVTQEYLVWNSDAWKPLLREFRPTLYREQIDVPLYRDQGGTQQFRLSAGEVLQRVAIARQDDDECVILLSGGTESHHVEQLVSLKRGEARLHVAVTCEFSGENPRLEYLLSSFAFQGSVSPDFTHVPAMKRAADDIIGDRVFNSPAALIQDKQFLVRCSPI